MSVRKKAQRFTRIVRDRLKSDGVSWHGENQLQAAFSKAIGKLPEGDLKEELNSNFKKYLGKLVRPLQNNNEAELNGTHDEALPSHTKPEEQRDPEEYVFNSYLRKKVNINEEKLMAFEPEKQQRICRCFLAQHLDKMKDLEKIWHLLQQGQDSSEEGGGRFQWLVQMKALCNTIAGNPSGSVLHAVMILFHRKLADFADSCINSNKKTRAQRLQKELLNVLMFFHRKYFSLPKTSPWCNPGYEDLMAAMLSIYVDLTLTTNSTTDVEKRKKYRLHLTSIVMYFLSHKLHYACDVIIQQTTANPSNADITLPLFRKALVPAPVIDGPELYTKYVAAVKQAVVALGEHLTTSILQAGTSVPAPRGYMDWLREQGPSIVDEIPETKDFRGTAITHFLLNEADEDLMSDLVNLLTAESEDDREMEEQGQRETEPAKTVQASSEETDLFFIDTRPNRKTVDGMREDLNISHTEEVETNEADLNRELELMDVGTMEEGLNISHTGEVETNEADLDRELELMDLGTMEGERADSSEGEDYVDEEYLAIHKNKPVTSGEATDVVQKTLEALDEISTPQGQANNDETIKCGIDVVQQTQNALGRVPTPSGRANSGEPVSNGTHTAQLTREDVDRLPTTPSQAISTEAVRSDNSTVGDNQPMEETERESESVEITFDNQDRDKPEKMLSEAGSGPESHNESMTKCDQAQDVVKDVSEPGTVSKKSSATGVRLRQSPRLLVLKDTPVGRKPSMSTRKRVLSESFAEIKEQAAARRPSRHQRSVSESQVITRQSCDDGEVIDVMVVPDSHSEGEDSDCMVTGEILKVKHGRTSAFSRKSPRVVSRAEDRSAPGSTKKQTYTKLKQQKLAYMDKAGDSPVIPVLGNNPVKQRTDIFEFHSDSDTPLRNTKFSSFRRLRKAHGVRQTTNATTSPTRSGSTKQPVEGGKSSNSPIEKTRKQTFSQPLDVSGESIAASLKRKRGPRMTDGLKDGASHLVSEPNTRRHSLPISVGHSKTRSSQKTTRSRRSTGHMQLRSSGKVELAMEQESEAESEVTFKVNPSKLRSEKPFIPSPQKQSRMTRRGAVQNQ